ncbi:MAG TPA: ATP-binding protein [Gemmatimonadaceae bacterium]
MQVTSPRFEFGPVGIPLRRAEARRRSHAVQFYETDAYLYRIVAEFAGEGLSNGQPVLIVAGADHAPGFFAAMRRSGIDIERETAAGNLTVVDARETLDMFMSDGVLDEDRFRVALGPLIDRASSLANGSAIRTYGEMVDLLWRDGKGSAAIQLESMWNELAELHPFVLLCTYNMSAFSDAGHFEPLDQICKAHTEVRPTERFLERTDEERLIEIALLQQRAHTLETEISRRELLEAKLRELVATAERAKTSAEQANRAKSQFLAVMSHELRTPLNAIGGYAELLDMGVHGDITDEQHDALVRIQRSQRHLLGLINQVLNYAKLETGTLRYEIIDVSLADAMRMVETLILPQIMAKGLHYSHVGSGPLLVRADREKLQQIILNLLGNAAKFTDEGGHVGVDCTADESTVFIRVHDSGIGIPSEKLGSIFEPFVQVDTNYTRTRDGIGLGLAISRDLARAMNGNLSVESVLGAGSTFTLALPRPAW